MFIDFYELLGISPNATNDEIKIAYRTQCIRWHPDKNSTVDTQRMQDINQAYLILKDPEARSRYDTEYLIFKAHFKNHYSKYNEQGAKDSSYPYTERAPKEDAFSNYSFTDKILEKWMANAKRQAQQMAKDAIDEFSGASKEAATSVKNYFLRIMIPMFLAFILFKSCLN